MQRARSTAGPSLKAGLKSSYNSIKEFADHVKEHPEALSFVGEDKVERRLEGVLITSSTDKRAKKKYHYLMFDEKLFDQFGETTMHVDGTFFVRPKIKGVNQLFTIMATKYNEVFSIQTLFNYLEILLQTSKIAAL